MTDVRVLVAPVPAAATFPLRQRVLRPHQRVADMGLSSDDDPAVLHLATVTADGDVTGCVRLEPVPCPWRTGTAWQLRAMAVEPGLRGQGLGAALVTAAVEHVAGRGGGLLWCNARLAAVPFYERAGFAVVTEAWDEPHIGPHVGMVRAVAP